MSRWPDNANEMFPSFDVLMPPRRVRPVGRIECQSLFRPAHCNSTRRAAATYRLVFFLGAISVETCPPAVRCGSEEGAIVDVCECASLMPSSRAVVRDRVNDELHESPPIILSWFRSFCTSSVLPCFYTVCLHPLCRRVIFPMVLVILLLLQRMK